MNTFIGTTATPGPATTRRFIWGVGSIRLGVGSDIQLFDLKNDLAETVDLVGDHRGIVARMAGIMQTAATPGDRYPFGEIYRGKAIWRPSWPTR